MILSSYSSLKFPETESELEIVDPEASSACLVYAVSMAVR
jgi:hypothetical protein